MKKGWLSGWKAIANYTDHCVKTAKKYEKLYGKPVHRGPGGKVKAIPAELDSWLVIFSDKRKKMKISPKCVHNLPKATPK